MTVSAASRIFGRRRPSLKRNTTARPDVFIVGAPKCGTSAMADFLGRNPEIFMARKEMHFFGSDLRFSRHFYRRGLDAYLGEFEGRRGQRYAGEASVWYLFSNSAAAEIKKFSPESRIIILLRDPVEMLHSLFYQFRCDGNEHLETFEEALAAEPDRRAGRRIARQAYFAQGLRYRETVRYTDQVRRYFDAFGRERVHVIVYDDLVLDAARTYLDTLAFLGVQPCPTDDPFKVVHPGSSIRSSALQTLLNDPALRSLALAVRPWIPRGAFNFFQRLDGRLKASNSRRQKRPPLRANLRMRLRREFAPEIERLSTLLGRDLTYWSKDEIPGAAELSRPAVLSTRAA